MSLATEDYETFQHQGQTWIRYLAPKPEEAYVMGSDLGQSQDPTAIAVLHHTRTPLDSWTTDMVRRTIRQDVEEFYDIEHAERVPLNTSYPDVVEHIRQLLDRPPLRDRCDLVIDESGVGRAVGDMFEAAGLRPIRVTITSGIDAVRQPERPRCWSVGKPYLISGVDARLHSGELRFAAEIGEASALAEELKDFRRHVTDAGRATYQARTGRHDDLVLAVAIALWWADERPKHRIRQGSVMGPF